MNIFLSDIFIFRGLILLLVAETSEQHRYLVMIKIITNIGFMVLKTTGLNPGFQRQNWFGKICLEPSELRPRISRVKKGEEKAKDDDDPLVVRRDWLDKIEMLTRELAVELYLWTISSE